MKDRHVDSLQIIYSILEQEPAKDFFPIAEQTQTGLLSRVPHASNTLTGEFIQVPSFRRVGPPGPPPRRMAAGGDTEGGNGSASSNWKTPAPWDSQPFSSS